MVGLVREIRLDFGSRQSIPALADAATVEGGSVAELRQRRLHTEYFDTTDLRLTRWGCSLAIRSDEGWMVKLPCPGPEEGSEALWHTDVHIAADGMSPPAAAQALVRPFTRGKALEVVARLHTSRQPARIDDADGRILAEVAEDHVRVEVPGQSTWHFETVEIVLAVGREESEISAITDRYRLAGAHSTHRSKLARALGVSEDATPDVVVPSLSCSPTAREVIHAAIARSVRSHLLHLPIARVGDGSKGVHQARVALRRLRSDLRTFGPLLESSWATELSSQARWLGDRLGEVRDADVRIEVLDRLIEQEPSIEVEDAVALLAEMRLQRAKAHANLIEALDAKRCTDLQDSLVEAAADPRTTAPADDPAEVKLPALTRRPWRKLNRAVARAGSEPNYADLHRIRIRAKRCRYAAEAVEPVVGKPARRMSKAMKRIQNSLGDLNDATVIRAHLAETAKQHEELGFMAGELSGLLIARAGHRATDFQKLWSKTKGIKWPE